MGAETKVDLTRGSWRCDICSLARGASPLRRSLPRARHRAVSSGLHTPRHYTLAPTLVHRLLSKVAGIPLIVLLRQPKRAYSGAAWGLRRFVRMYVACPSSG